MRLGWVSSFNAKCGIATYSEHMLASIGKLEEAVIFAEYSSNPVRQDSSNVIRCWERSGPLNHLLDSILQSKIEVLVFQFHQGLFYPGYVNEFIKQIKHHNIKLIFMIHSPPYHPIPNLVMCDRVTVQIQRDYEIILQQHDLRHNMGIHPHGIQLNKIISNYSGEKQFPLIGCFGFSLPNKGIVELLQALMILKNNNFSCKFHLLNAQHEYQLSASYVATCRHIIESNNLNDSVNYTTDFLSDEESQYLLTQCDFLISPYQNTSEPVSGSVRHLIATGLPVAVTPVSIFNDVREITYQLEGTTPENIASSIPKIWSSIRTKDETYQEITSKADRWRNENSYQTLSTKLLNLLNS